MRIQKAYMLHFGKMKIGVAKLLCRKFDKARLLHDL